MGTASAVFVYERLPMSLSGVPGDVFSGDIALNRDAIVFEGEFASERSPLSDSLSANETPMVLSDE